MWESKHFMGAEKELARTVEELSQNKLEAFLHSKLQIELNGKGIQPW